MAREMAVPFSIDANGSVATTTNVGQILHQRVLSVLGTQPGERGMRPNYGCDIQRFAFSLGDELVKAEMRASVDNALKKHCPDALLVSLEANPPTEDGLFLVVVTYKNASDPRDLTNTAVLQFAVQSDGGTITTEVS